MLELNQIYCGDCLQAMKEIDDNSIDLTVTSPPYDMLRDYKNNIGGSWGEHIWKPAIRELYRITKSGGTVVWIVGDATIKGSESGTSFRQALYFKEVGFSLHDTMIFLKDSFSFPSTVRYHQVFEYMFIFSKGKLKTFNPIRDKKNKCSGNVVQYNDRQKNGILHKKRKTVVNEYSNRTNVWLIGSGGTKSTGDKIAFKHPAIFPEKLANDHIISWSNEGDVVLDPFVGSGTTLKMAKSNNRNFIGMDKVDEYCQIACERVGLDRYYTIKEEE